MKMETSLLEYSYESSMLQWLKPFLDT